MAMGIGAVIGGVTSGISYLLNNPGCQFDAHDMGRAMMLGMAMGIGSGLIGFGVGAALPVGASWYGAIGFGALGGGIAGGMEQVMVNMLSPNTKLR